MMNTAPFRLRLQNRRAELAARLQALETALDAPLSADSEDQAIELEDDEAQVSLAGAAAREMRRIDAALHRITTGGYGVCLVCGGDILPERLAAVPDAATCRDCG